jgi:hypothetical protein
MRFDAISRNFSLVMPGQKAPGAVFKHREEASIDLHARSIAGSSPAMTRLKTTAPLRQG